MAGFGSSSNDEVVTFFQTKGSEMSGMSLEALLDCHPIARHYIEKTPQAITVGVAGPDGPVHSLDGGETTLHGEIRSAGRKLTLLNFGSYT